LGHLRGKVVEAWR